jgi:hypothetical protein
MMSEVPPPDWAALYQQHRDAMYRVAARVLRGDGRADEAGDAVSAAMESLMKSPPANVLNWQAVRGAASAAPRRSIASLPSANFRRKASRARPARPSGHSGSDRGRGVNTRCRLESDLVTQEARLRARGPPVCSVARPSHFPVAHHR